jgi:hypothetical protein
MLLIKGPFIIYDRGWAGKIQLITKQNVLTHPHRQYNKCTVAEHNWDMPSRASRAKGWRKFLNLESLKCYFLDFEEDLTEF